MAEELKGELGNSRVRFKDQINNLRKILNPLQEGNYEEEGFSPSEYEDELISQYNLPVDMGEAKDISTKSVSDIQSAPRVPAGVEDEAWKVLQDRVQQDPSGNLFHMLSGESIAGASAVDEDRYAAAQKILELGRQSRKEQREEKSSPWKAKYEEAIRTGRMKDFVSGQIKQAFIRDRSLRDLEQKSKDAKNEILKAQNEYEWSKKFGDLESAKKYQKQMWDLDKKLFDYKLLQAKKEKEEGADLGVFSKSVADMFADQMNMLRLGDSVLGEFVDYANKHGAKALKDNKKFGVFANKMRDAKQAVRAWMKKENLDWKQVGMKHTEFLSNWIRSMSGVAVTPNEYRILASAIPDKGWDYDKFIDAWKGIMASRTYFLRDRYDMAKTGSAWGSEKNKSLAFALYDEFKGIEGKYSGYRPKKYDPKVKFKGMKKLEEEGDLMEKYTEFYKHRR